MASGLEPRRARISLSAAAGEPQNWLTHGGTYEEQRFSPLKQIDAANISRLRLAWYYDLDTSRGQESTPLVVDGTLYASTAWSKVVALDAATGALRWKYDPHVPGAAGFKACCDVVNRGVAYDDGRIFLGSLDGRLIALDAKSGRQLWSVVTVDQSKSYTITGAPRVVKGNVIIGNGGAEYGLRGYVSAYSAKTGQLRWRFYTVREIRRLRRTAPRRMKRSRRQGPPGSVNIGSTAAAARYGTRLCTTPLSISYISA